MDGAMVTPTEQRQVRQRGGPAIRPMPEVMALREAQSTAREATAAVPML